MNNDPEYEQAVGEFCDAFRAVIKTMQKAGETALQISTELTHGLDFDDPNREFAVVEVYIKKKMELEK